MWEHEQIRTNTITKISNFKLRFLLLWISFWRTTKSFHAREWNYIIYFKKERKMYWEKHQLMWFFSNTLDGRTLHKTKSYWVSYPCSLWFDIWALILTKISYNSLRRLPTLGYLYSEYSYVLELEFENKISSPGKLFYLISFGWKDFSGLIIPFHIFQTRIPRVLLEVSTRKISCYEPSPRSYVENVMWIIFSAVANGVERMKDTEMGEINLL